MPYKQNPFSLYDFLGYLIPGIALLTTIFLALNHTETYNITNYIKTLKDTHLIPLTVITAYITGHILGILSSITIEKSYIRGNGYPSKSILDPSNAAANKTDSKPAKARPIDTIFDLHRYTAQQIMRTFHTSSEKNRIDPAIAEQIKKKIKKFFRNEYEYEHDDILQKEYFHAIYHYCVENTPNHLPKIQNYVALYGLMRNTALASIIPFWIAATLSINNIFISIVHDSEITISYPKLFIMAGSLLTFSILHAGFIKFYTRFSFEVLMAFSTCYKPEKKHHQSLRKIIAN